MLATAQAMVSPFRMYLPLVSRSVGHRRPGRNFRWRWIVYSPHEQVKIKILTEFYETALVDKAWKLEGVGEGDERKLLERFSSVTTVFQSLPAGSRQVRAHHSRFFVVHCCCGWSLWCDDNRVCRGGRPLTRVCVQRWLAVLRRPPSRDAG